MWKWQKESAVFEKGKNFVMNHIGHIVLAGVVLLFAAGFLPEKKEHLQTNSLEVEKEEEEYYLTYVRQQEKRLSEILSQIEGAGKTEVMIQIASSGEKVTLADTPSVQKKTSEQDSAGGSREVVEIERECSTVYESSGNSQVPYVVKELQPEISGILVVAEGAGSDTIKAEITEAVEALFGIPAHRIKVIKRRG